MKMESFAVGYRQQSSIFQYNMTCIIVFKNILFIFKRFKLKLWHVTKIDQLITPRFSQD